ASAPGGRSARRGVAAGPTVTLDLEGERGAGEEVGEEEGKKTVPVAQGMSLDAHGTALWDLVWVIFTFQPVNAEMGPGRMFPVWLPWEADSLSQQGRLGFGLIFPANLPSTMPQGLLGADDHVASHLQRVVFV